MRLEKLSLLRYGPFDRVDIDLDAAPGKLNLICAPNGAGKSVLRQAFQDLLFGIPGQTPMGFRYGYTGMRLAATAVADGAMYSFGRRKGQGNTWTDAEGIGSGTPEIAAAFHRTEPLILERLFALDTDRLRTGGDRLLTEQGSVADALLSARGLSGARGIRQALLQHADELAPQRRAASRPYYQALDKFTAARRAAAEALLRPEAWERLRQQAEQAEATLEEYRRAATAAAIEVGRLQRIRRVRVCLAEHDDATAWLAKYPNAPELPTDLASRFAEARQRLTIAVQREDAETARHAKLLAQHQSVVVDEKLLAEAPVIDALAVEAGRVSQTLTDIPKRAAERSEIRKRIEHYEQRLGHEASASVVFTPPSGAIEARARELIGQAEARHAAVSREDTRLAEVARGVAEREAQLAALPPHTDTLGLAALVAEIRAAGDPAAQAEEMAQLADRTRGAVATSLAQVPGWRGTAAALQDMRLMPDASYDRVHQTLLQAEAALTRANDLLAAARARQDAAAKAVTSFKDQGEIPDRAAISGARQSRDALYGLIARLAFGGTKIAPAELLQLAGDVPLSLAHEQAVVRADRLADRRADESDLIASASEAARRLKAANDEVAEVTARQEAASADASASQAAWQTILPAFLPPGARLDDVRAFLAARKRVIEQATEAVAAASRVERLTERHTNWASALATLLQVPAAPLPSLLARADQKLAAAHRADRERTSLQASLQELARSRSKATAAREAAAACLAEWRRDWSATLEALGRPQGETPTVTAEILRLLTELARECERESELAQRINEMTLFNNQFISRAAALLDRIALANESGDDPGAMLTIIRALCIQLAENREHDTLRRALAQQVEQAALDLTDLARVREARTSSLRDLVEACGAADPDEAERRLAESAVRAENVTTLTRTRTLLLAEGDGLPLEVLRAEVTSLSPDRVQPALAEAESAAAAAQTKAQEAAADLRELTNRLDQRARETAYADARADVAEAAATAGRTLEEALTDRLAASLLKHAMEEVEAAGGSEMLAQIGDEFRKLTGGAYSRVATEEGEDGRQVLIAVPFDRPDELKRMHQLSEGTRDQLYLALRLKAVADHPDRLPFIADDILQSFDDARAEAALNALLDLSQRVQVIVLTHHRHIVTLSERLPTGSVHLPNWNKPAVFDANLPTRAIDGSGGMALESRAST